MWESLSDIKFIIGRTAVEADINSGCAAFVIKFGDEYSGIEYKLTIPQYAIFTDADTREKKNCIVIQAEEFQNKVYIGAKVNGTDEKVVGILTEFKLLGKKVV